MERLPKRDDEIYKEIEDFEEYELTQCVAYEMAIRNDGNLKHIQKIAKDYDDYLRDKNDCFKLDNTLSLSDKGIKEHLKLYILKEITLKDLSQAINYSEIIPFIPNDTHELGYSSEHLDDFVDNFMYYKDKRIDNKVYELIDIEITGSQDHLKRGIYSEEVRITHIDETDWTTLEKNTFRNGYTIRTEIQEVDGRAIIPINDDENCDEYKEILEIEDWRKYIIDYEGEVRINHEITNNFKRPKLKLYKEDIYNAAPKLNININQPLNELIAYITHIKEDLEKNKDILKAPIELLGEKLQRADNMVCDSKGKCFDAREMLSKQQKLADMFFIYDCLKVDMTQRKIQNEVYNYYADKGVETKTLDAKTLKKYKEIASDYIDNMRYRELATGVKI